MTKDKFEKLPDLEAVIKVKTKNAMFKSKDTKYKEFLVKTDNAYKIGDRSDYLVLCDIHIFSVKDNVKYKRNLKKGFKKEIADVFEEGKEVVSAKNRILLYYVNSGTNNVLNNLLPRTYIMLKESNLSSFGISEDAVKEMIDHFRKEYDFITNPSGDTA